MTAGPVASSSARELAGEEKAFRAIFRPDLFLVRQVIARSCDVEITRFNGGFYRFRDGRFDVLFLVTRIPRRLFLEVLRIGSDLQDGGRELLIGN